MKARVFFIEADDLSPSDVGAILSTVLNRPAAEPPALPAPTAPALPVPEPERPPHTKMQMAPMPRTWRPKAKKVPTVNRANAKAERDDGESSHRLRPVQPEKFMCDQCGEDRPEGKDGRARCAKCGARAWAKVGGKEELADALPE